MNPAPQPTERTPALFWSITLALAALALLPTLWPALDLAAAAPFMGRAPAIDAREWPWVRFINDWVPAVFRGVMLLALIAWAWLKWRARLPAWRLALLFFAVGGLIGPGAVVNLVFKDHWQRARPYQVEYFGGDKQFTRATLITNQCSDNCSFVSGHVACGYFLIGLMLVHRRRARAWALAGLASAAAIAFARIADQAHWLSDTLWAGPITLLSSWLVWRALLAYQHRGKAPKTEASA